MGTGPCAAAKPRFRILVSALSFCLAAPTAAAPAAIVDDRIIDDRIIDDRGVTLRLPQPAQRVVSLAPHLTELVFAAGGVDRLVGVVQGSDYPEAARTLPGIGDASGIDIERVLTLKPDLVLAWQSGNRAVDVARLERLGLKLLVLEPRRLDDIARHLRMLGQVLDTRARADAAAEAFSRRMAALRSRYRGALPVSVLFEAWHQPLITVNAAHLISDVLALCGGRNVFADLPQLAGAVSMEAVLRADPQAIVIGSEAADAGAPWRRHRGMAAVRNGHVFAVAPDLINRQTPRVLDAAEKICADLDSVRAGR